jgi:hypothetical protein
MHKHHPSKKQGRKIRGLIFSNSFRDAKQAETISQVTQVDILGLIDEPVRVSDVPDVEKGEILIDERGRGSFQKCED